MRAGLPDLEGHRDGTERAERETPAKTAAATFLAFVVAGWTPLVPYLLSLEPLFELSVLFTGVAFFGVGASRTLVTDGPWWRNGTEMFVVGMAAALVAFTVGNLLENIA
ncbi:VIT1/CCC1 transporter family protein [Haloarculaceae archaeon H-GB2-1]|nr:VIT1/CCC1 transporter family protein [Haloarculaceae archaeon H-GB2-1]